MTLHFIFNLFIDGPPLLSILIEIWIIVADISQAVIEKLQNIYNCYRESYNILTVHLAHGHHKFRAQHRHLMH